MRSLRSSFALTDLIFDMNTSDTCLTRLHGAKLADDTIRTSYLSVNKRLSAARSRKYTGQVDSLP